MSTLYDRKYQGKGDLIIELGSGNGQTLVNLAARNAKRELYFMGIESNLSLYKESCSLLNENDDNITFINDDFEHVINRFHNESVSMFISVLPHPNYIGKEREFNWKNIYEITLSKMKKYGQFLLITECTNELLSEVTVEEYKKWRTWLISSFESIGFIINVMVDNPPPALSSYYLSKFKNDPNRIKILTILMQK